MKEITFESLVGKHLLTGIDLTNRMEAMYEGATELESCQVCNFVLDGQTYTALEDPDDGYRSSMKYLVLSDEKVINTFPAVEVTCTHRTVGGFENCREDDVLEFRDCANGKLILEVGTTDTDDYYPSFVSDWNPANLSVNDRVK